MASRPKKNRRRPQPTKNHPSIPLAQLLAPVQGLTWEWFAAYGPEMPQAIQEEVFAVIMERDAQGLMREAPVERLETRGRRRASPITSGRRISGSILFALMASEASQTPNARRSSPGS
jgi:hypothetical protein